jgi:hypothetical protein
VRLFVLILAALTLAGCTAVRQEDRPVRVCEPDVVGVPCGAGVETDKRYVFDLLTHCGGEWAYFDGRYWVPARPTDPPPDWASVKRGTMTLVDRDSAHFAGGSAGRVRFVPARSSFRPETCA